MIINFNFLFFFFFFQLEYNLAKILNLGVLMKFCKRCVMPDTKPNLNFDEDGICDACRSQEAKNSDIDWQSRKAELL